MWQSVLMWMCLLLCVVVYCSVSVVYLNECVEVPRIFLPLKGHYHITSSTFFPATVKHKACLRSCHRKRHISREQVPFLFSKTIPMACRTVSCSLGSIHHLKHLAALQQAAALRWEPKVPLLSWARRSMSHSSHLSGRNKEKPVM